MPSDCSDESSTQMGYLLERNTRVSPLFTTKNTASAVGAKTARACDICVRRRARWYCAPDDAFLCQSCDESIHSANLLARRHERVRLNASSTATCLPTWHRGPTKKPRTPRHRKKTTQHHHLLVPELETSTSMEADQEQEEEELLYRVPVFEYDFDMEEFAADVEALLGNGDHSCGMEDLGLLIDDSDVIKIEKLEEKREELEVIQEPFELTFDYDSLADLKIVIEPAVEKMKLKLDYDAISSSWGTQGSPWMNGKRPDFNLDDGLWGISALGDELQESKEMRLMKGGQLAVRGDDGGREARVSRYREKRRTRLFSKKIRYEVRKLNAEKRPRMKGRFVKRSSFS